MIYETRVYSCQSGRLSALLQLFEVHTLKLFEKHGIRQIGFFTALEDDSSQELTYLLAWESTADREQKWAALLGDAEWIAARTKAEEDGEIVEKVVSQLLRPTAFSALT
ncbi:NIPSNAP family protein [Bradyrhizobium sp. Cp5.3]|uniref:NIPSNAP family protein n=1 Tax=Bradyrhizobium sp. Cp5.3 TaxID=443598 RepID=UPI0004290EAA|nr:NIPSNAP family protein [Bradyrhizobium sp. Cp5.3]